MTFAHYPVIWGIGPEFDLRPRDRLVLLALAEYADTAGKCWPSQRTLSEATGLSVRTVRRALEGLAEQGLIRRTPRYINGQETRRTSDVIHLHLPTAPDNLTASPTGGDIGASMAGTLGDNVQGGAVPVAAKPLKEASTVEPDYSPRDEVARNLGAEEDHWDAWDRALAEEIASGNLIEVTA